MQYYTAVNTGKGFITNEDMERSYIGGYPGDVWVTEDNEPWAQRVGAVSKTHLQAQAIVDSVVNQAISEWDLCIADNPNYQYPCGPRPIPIVLPV
jgi:hypothetical protein